MTLLIASLVIIAIFVLAAIVEVIYESGENVFFFTMLYVLGLILAVYIVVQLFSN